jgi:hypothetical protein
VEHVIFAQYTLKRTINGRIFEHRSQRPNSGIHVVSRSLFPHASSCFVEDNRVESWRQHWFHLDVTLGDVVPHLRIIQKFGLSVYSLDILGPTDNILHPGCIAGTFTTLQQAEALIEICGGARVRSEQRTNAL